jgi:hypothetical protein
LIIFIKAPDRIPTLSGAGQATFEWIAHIPFPISKLMFCTLESCAAIRHDYSANGKKVRQFKARLNSSDQNDHIFPYYLGTIQPPIARKYESDKIRILGK